MTVPAVNERERKAHKAAVRREWRSTRRRVDFYCTPETEAVLIAMREPRAGYDYSSLLNVIVHEWAAQRFPEKHHNEQGHSFRNFPTP